MTISYHSNSLYNVKCKPELSCNFHVWREHRSYHSKFNQHDFFSLKKRLHRRESDVMRLSRA